MTAPTAVRAKTRVLIIEDHVVFAESLELALSIEGYDARRLPLPDCARSGELVATVARLRPRVVLLDLDLGSFGDGVRLIHPMARSGANVVVVTASADKCLWGECMRNGARKTLTKTQPLNEMLAVVRRIQEGLPVVSAAEREDLLACWDEHRIAVEQQRERLGRLTRREREVLAQLTLGRSVREVARTSFVSEATVRTQVKSILAKLDVSSQLAAVGLANHAGWRPPVDA
ncbi:MULTISPECIES: response regulator [Nocardioides]|uniref:Response regulator n=1 Tax=Nocardioides vastitatis TaxID=2568655 RepID=A0ABW0ZFJ9_9ACTN|nr:response regulator transcription factor [Nocardioides sp.]THI96942.1 response regulator transcription factor [Nocardioides sp.]